MLNCEKISSKEILEKTLQYVAPLPSQLEYARNLATIFSMHLHKNQLIDRGIQADALPAPSALVVASTGQGKTYLIRKMAECLGVNLITMDCSSLAAEGWKGISMTQRLAAAMSDAKDEKSFQQSILFFDEVDKLRFWGTKNDQGNAMNNILQLYNGGAVSIEQDKKVINVDIRRFTILLGGAFAGIEDIIRARVCPKARIGFSNQVEKAEMSKAEIMKSVNTEDLEKYGMMPELLGRIGTILTIPPLSLLDYRQLLSAEAGSLQCKYNNYLSLYGVSFAITEPGVKVIADKCMTANTGARAVNPLVDELMRRAIENVENDETINRVLLDADGNDCCIRYEHGSKKKEPADEQKGSGKELPWHTIKANNTPALVRKLCRYYRNVAGDQAVLKQLEAFLNCAVPYLHKRCDKSEFTLQSLLILAGQTRKNGEQSSFELKLRRTYCIQRTTYNEYVEAYNNWFSQNVTSALEEIRRYIWAYHGERQVRFEVPTGR